MTGTNGGLWRSVDTGQTWQELSQPSVEGTTCSDIVLNLQSATVNTVSNPTGNVNVLYAAFPGHGVYISPNRGQVLNLMTGGNVDPLITDVTNGRNVQVPVSNGNSAPTGANGGLIKLARPALLPSTAPNADVENTLYASWLYAAATDSTGNFIGLYLTKDNGTTWTQVKLSNVTTGLIPVQAVPSNDPTRTNENPTGSPIYHFGPYDLALSVDPNNPSVAYIGGSINGNGSGLIRVDTSRIYDSHAVLAYSPTRPDGGTDIINSTGRTPVVNNTYTPSEFIGSSNQYALNPGPYLNLVQNPDTPFQTNTTVFVFNVNSFTNDGSGTRWIPIDPMLQANASSLVPSSNVTQIVSEVDPLTGLTRLIVTDDQGVFTGEFNADGTLTTGFSNAPSPTYSRNGNLQIAQLVSGTAQPSSTPVNSQVALDGLFFGNGVNVGQTASDPNVLNNGNISGVGSTDGSPLGKISQTSGDSYGTGVAVDQQGNNIVYRFYWPSAGGNKTDFFQVSTNGGPFISRTTGLVQTANDPQWPGFDGGYLNGTALGQFAVNPIDGNEVMISSAVGRIFATINQGDQWLSIGEPGSLDGSYAPALAFGAPDPNAPGGVGNLNNFLYAGTVNGNIFVSQTGGGAAFNAWTKISTGLDGSPVVSIYPDPIRGTHDAYAVTQKGVYYIADSTASNAAWQNITSNLFQLTTSPFGNASAAQPSLTFLTALQVDYRYAIPNASGGGTHPVLYVSGNSGVYRSLDNGATWAPFPNAAFDGAPVDGGYLPNVDVTALNLSDGKIDTTTGRAVLASGDPNALLATTYGRGQFAIRLAPIVFPSTVTLDTTLPAPSGSTSGKDANGLPLVDVAQPVFDGVSEQSAFGNTVYISVLDLTNPNAPVVIGGYDPSNPATMVAANQTNAAGQFQIQVNPDGFSTNGVKTIGIQATDASGTPGNIVTLSIDLNAHLNTKQAPTSPTLLLNSSDDSSNGKDITNVTSPHLIGVTNPGVTVQLFASSGGKPTGSALGSATTDTQGNYSIQLHNLAQGVYTLQSVATNAYGSSTSSVFTFTVKTTGPTTKPTLSLDPADNTGIAGGNITANHEPQFIGTTDPNANVSLYKVVNGVIQPVALVTTSADASGHYTIQLPNNLSNGTITLEVGVSDVAGNQGPNSNPLTVTITTVPGDFTGTYKTTPALFRRSANGGGLFLIKGVPPLGGIPFGSSVLDVPFVGAFNSSGASGLAVYRPSTQTWYIQGGTLGMESFVLGKPGALPVVGNFDGTQVTEAAVFQPTTGTWSIASTTNGTETFQFPATPQAGDIPVPGNYDNTGKDELAVYRPSTGQWIINGPKGPYTIQFGGPGFLPVPGSYLASATSQADEPAVFNPTTGLYVIYGGAAGNTSIQFAPGDIPAPGQYDGQGKTEPAVYNPTVAAFQVNSPTGESFSLGQAGDIPLSAPLAYREVISTTPTLGLAPGTDTGIVGDGVTSNRHPIVTGTTDPNAYVDIVNTANNAVIASGIANGSGLFTIPLSTGANLPNGTYVLEARAHTIGNTFGPVSTPFSLRLTTVEGDSVGIGRTQPTVFVRTNPYVIQWFVDGNPAVFGRPFGAGGFDIPLTGDFTGSGQNDLAVYRPGTAQWFIATPSTGYQGQFLASFGAPNLDIPVPADYLGNGHVDVAVYRPTTGQFFVQGIAGATTVVPVKAGDVPVPANYDNTGKAEFAVYRQGTGQWYIDGPKGAYTVNFGGPGYIAVPGAYLASATSQAAEPAVFNPTTGLYVIDGGAAGNRIMQFAPGDIPAPGDYEGTGVTEAAVFRPSTGQWLVQGPNDAKPRVIVPNFGASGFVPSLAPYQYRAISGTSGIQSLSLSSGSRGASTFDLAATARAFSGGTFPTAAPAPTSPATSSVFSNPHRKHPRTAQHPLVHAPRLFSQRPAQTDANARPRHDLGHLA